MDTTEKLTHLSLCTGYAGIDLGLGRALGDVRTVAYVEIEAFAIENLVSKIEGGLLDVAPIWTDLKTFPWSEFREKVDILSGGFPCQPFSSAGRRAGDDDPRHLWPYIVRGIRELGHPPVVFLENVEGIISSRLKSDQWADPEDTPVLLHVLRELERLGYTATAGVFSAREVGAPHRRKRLFIMGVRSDLGQSGRDLVSGMLRCTERRKMLADPLCRGICEPRATLHKNGTPLEVEGQSIQSKRDARAGDVKHAGSTMGYPKSRNIKSTRRGRGSYKTMVLGQIRESSTVYPAPRGAVQYTWEPPRVTTENQPAMGRDRDGVADRMDYAELCRSVDNRTDELRLLGNGVVPDTAERAFRVLWRSLEYP